VKSVALLACVLGGCATTHTRDVNGNPYTLYFQCRADSPHRVQPVRGGGTEPCPNLVEIDCPDGDGGRERFQIVLVDYQRYYSSPPVKPDEMCRRIRAVD
jgi:hypothetical protein